MFNINQSSPLPLYYQVREEIRQKILSGEWPYGYEVPSEPQICAMLDLSRTTIKQALDGLVNDNLIIRKRGKGTFVNYLKFDYRLMEEPNFFMQLAEEGHIQDSILIEKDYRPASRNACQALGVETGTEVAYFKRIRCVNGVPTIIQIVYVLKEYEQDLLNQNLEKISFHKYLEDKNHFTLNHFNMKISSIILSEEDAHYLNCTQLTSGFLFHTIFKSHTKNILYNERVFRGDVVNLQLSYDFHKDGQTYKNFELLDEKFE